MKDRTKQIDVMLGHAEWAIEGLKARKLERSEVNAISGAVRAAASMMREETSRARLNGKPGRKRAA